MVATASGLAAQTSGVSYAIWNITPAPTSDYQPPDTLNNELSAQGPSQLVPPLVITGTCAQTIWSVDIYSGQYSTTQSVWQANPASLLGPGFMIGYGGVCQQPANITRRTFGVTNDSTVNGVDTPVPSIGTEMSAKWLYTLLGVVVTERLHDQWNITCDGFNWRVNPLTGPYPC